ncbi:MAG: hypothetical protein QOH26_1276 [Actinomycetota bacterium]|jgi:hypothetical protein|nr:hypothetical protein [Actinomycetota bacterium]
MADETTNPNYGFPSQAVSMPDPGEITPVHSNFVYWGRILWGMPVDLFVPSAILITLARLVDKALDEYFAARAEVFAHIERRWNPDITHLTRATNHMETLVGALWRLFGLAQAIRRHPDAPLISRAELPTRGDFERLNGIRRAIEHMDARIRDGRVQPGDPTMVMLGDSSIRLEGWEVSHDELAWWIALMSNLVIRLRVSEARTPSEEWPGIVRMFSTAMGQRDSGG